MSLYQWWFSHRWLFTITSIWNVCDSIENMSMMTMVMCWMHLVLFSFVTLMGDEIVNSIPILLEPMYDSDDSDVTVICSEASASSDDDGELFS